MRVHERMSSTVEATMTMATISSVDSVSVVIDVAKDRYRNGIDEAGIIITYRIEQHKVFTPQIHRINRMNY